MLQTELIQPYLIPKTELQNREETVKECINEINSLDENLQEFFLYKEKSFVQKLKSTFSCLMTYLGILVLSFGILILIALKFSDGIYARNIVGVLSIILITLSIWTISDVFLNNLIESKNLINKEEENKKSIISLFSSLSDKKFEIRGELLENYSKLKLIIEENQYIDGTTSVIKNSSKSLTAYINMTEDKESIIRSVVSIVKESEKKFN